MTQSMTQPVKARRQVRNFVIIWTFITLIMGMATFLAIYFTYSPQAESSRVSVALPPDTGDALIVLPSVTAPAATNTPPVTPTNAATQVVTDALVLNATATIPATETPLPTPTPTLLPAEDERYAVGIQVQYSLDFNADNQDGLFRSVADDLGLSWVKQQVRWEDIERERGQRDFSVLDLVIPSAQRFGIKIMLSIVTAPDWAREPGVDTSRHGPPANPQDYVDFVTAILDRYPGQIHAIEVWNEQNLDREWTSTQGLNAANYVTLLQQTYDAVKAIDPGIIIISGALSPTGFDNGVNAINDFRYMQMLIDAQMLNHLDCVGAHHNGYNIGPSLRYDAVPNDPSATFRGPFDNPHHSWSFRSTLEGYATRIRAAGSDAKLCVTEFGWATTEDLDGYPAGFEFANDNTLEEQATYLAEAMANMETWDTVWLAFIWNFNYAPQAGYSTDNDNVPYSLIGPGYVFRPAYDSIREWQRGYLARTGQS